MRRLMLGVWLLGILAYAFSSSTDNPADETAKLPINTVGIDSKRTALKPSTSPAERSTVDNSSRALAAEEASALAAEEASYEEPVEWVKVAQAVAAHSEPSVSSPTTYRYHQGKELQVLRRELPWVEVLDPATKFRGWVLHIYLSSPHVSVAQSAGDLSDPEKPAPPLMALGTESEPLASEGSQARKLELSSPGPKQSTTRKRAARETRKAVRAKSRGYEEYAEPPLYTRRGYRRGYAFERYAARPYYANTYRERRFLARPPGFIRFRGLF